MIWIPRMLFMAESPDPFWICYWDSVLLQVFICLQLVLFVILIGMTCFLVQNSTFWKVTNKILYGIVLRMGIYRNTKLKITDLGAMDVLGIMVPK